MTKMLYIYFVTCRELIDHIYNIRKAQLAREQYQINITNKFLAPSKTAANRQGQWLQGRRGWV